MGSAWFSSTTNPGETKGHPSRSRSPWDAEGNQAVGNLFGERAGLGALACHVDRHVDRAIGQPAFGREDLGETAVDVGNVAAQQCLNLRDMRAHAREAQGLLAHPRTAGKAGAEPDHQAPRRDLLESRDGRGLCHRMAIAGSLRRPTDTGPALGTSLRIRE